ncbi:hypothetical protein [Olleya namhaensis]|uniref:hypothetical protein n=1 Tax=Olleya namhaensis TaxID=1144750 RepID=UPI00248FB445|nr:hypothetical protein [Olleya namhaensis]
MINKIICATVISLLLFSCDNTEKEVKTITVEPSQAILKNIPSNDFSLVLDDMTIEETENQIIHKHKYKVLELKKDSLYSTDKDWAVVNQTFFSNHKNDLGMEILSRHNGKVSTLAQPVGFGWAIGNTAHGEWEETKKDSTSTSNSGTTHRRWRTHSTSPFFWLWLGSRRSIYRSDYTNYRTYNTSGRSYYGQNSNNTYGYGTRSSYQKKTRSSFFTRQSKNTSRWNNLEKRTSRSSSRYKSGSSTRSRSGGTGK